MNSFNTGIFLAYNLEQVQILTKHLQSVKNGKCTVLQLQILGQPSFFSILEELADGNLKQVIKTAQEQVELSSTS